MPVIKLSTTERRQLAYALSELKQAKLPQGKKPQSDKTLIASGKKLITQARCAACHTIPGIETPAQQIVDLSKSTEDWKNSCLAETPDLKKGRPAYRTIDREAVSATASTVTNGTNTKASPRSPARWPNSILHSLDRVKA